MSKGPIVPAAGDDEGTLARVVESLVTAGDVSALTPEQRVWFYRRRCADLGLDPASKPFDILRLSGKLVLYANKGATDQLARLHHVSRTVKEGPDVREVEGTKLAFCRVEARTPDGRAEEEVATCPVVDLPNLLMKVATKAKRRATLAILGIGMLDESELETIPASAKALADPIDPTRAALPVPTSPLLLAPGPDPEIAEREALFTAAQDAAKASRARAEPIAQIGGLHDPTTGATTRAAKIAVLDAAAFAALGAAPPTSAEFTAAWEAAVAAIHLPGSAPDLWRTHRTALSGLGAEARKTAWKHLVARVAKVGHQSEHDAERYLKGAVKAKDTVAPTARYAGLAVHQLHAADVPLADLEAWVDAVLPHLARVRDAASLDTWETALAERPAELRGAPAWARIDAALGAQRAAVGGVT